MDETSQVEVSQEVALAAATQFTFGPRDDEDAYRKTIVVAWRGGDTWAVLRRGRDCYTRNGEWMWEPQPSSRDDEFLRETRFSRDEALRIAASLVSAVLGPSS